MFFSMRKEKAGGYFRKAMAEAMAISRIAAGLKDHPTARQFFLKNYVTAEGIAIDLPTPETPDEVAQQTGAGSDQ